MNKRIVKTFFVFLLLVSISFVNIDKSKAMGEPNNKGWAECHYYYISHAQIEIDSSESWNIFRYDIYVFIDTNKKYNGYGRFWSGLKTDTTPSLGYIRAAENLERISGPPNYSDFFNNAKGLKANFRKNKKWVCPSKIWVDIPEPDKANWKHLNEYNMYMDRHENSKQVNLFDDKSVQKGKHQITEQAEKTQNEDAETSSKSNVKNDIDIGQVVASNSNIKNVSKGKYTCDLISPKIKTFLDEFFLIIQVFGVILLVVMSMIEFVKAITASDDDGLKGAIKNTYRRIIIAIILLILPMFIGWIIGLINDNAYVTDNNGKRIIGADGDPLCKNSSSSSSGLSDDTDDIDSGVSSTSSSTSNKSNNNTKKSTNVADAEITGIARSYYTTSLSKVTPKPTVRLSGKKLVKGTNYSFTCKNNKKPGTATCTIKGKGKYTGSKNVKFKLVNMGDDVARVACRLSYSRGKYYNNGKYPGTRAYLNAWEAAGRPNGDNHPGRTCGAAVATIYRVSGYDTKMASMANKALGYLANSSKWTKVGTYSHSRSIEANKLQPGDVLVRKGHIWMFVGSSIPKSVYRNEIKGSGVSGGDTGSPNGVWMSAHLSVRGGAAAGIGNASWSLANNPSGHTVYIYRCTKPNDRSYRHGAAVD